MQCTARTDLKAQQNTKLYELIFRLIFLKFHPAKRGWEKLVYRLIVMFLSTEIFSKRRKIYTWIEEKPEWPKKPKARLL